MDHAHQFFCEYLRWKACAQVTLYMKKDALKEILLCHILTQVSAEF